MRIVGHMNLHAYMTSTKIKPKDLAAKVKCSPIYIRSLRTGVRTRPSLKIALAIEKATGGKVPVKAWGE